MFAAALWTKHKNFPTLWDDVSSKLTRYSHWTLYDNVSHSVRFSAQRETDTMFHDRRLCERLVKTTQNFFLNLS